MQSKHAIDGQKAQKEKKERMNERKKEKKNPRQDGEKAFQRRRNILAAGGQKRGEKLKLY